MKQCTTGIQFIFLPLEICFATAPVLGDYMEAAQKLLIGAASVLMLCVSLYLVLFENHIVTNIFDVVRNQMKDEELYQQYYTEDVEEVPYAELVATLLNDLEYDIVIDGALIQRNEHDIEKIRGYILKENDYLKEYQYNESGTIEIITYTSKE
jgi:hypothetical protein